MNGDATADAPVPPADGCYLDAADRQGWEVFGPGWWNKQYFTPADCERMVANFNRLSVGPAPAVTAKVKLGHDTAQRLKQSLGYPNLGQPTRMWLKPNGKVALRVDNVPLAIGGEINAGRLHGGSVEIKASVPDPDDPSREIEGPALTAISLLGEEDPAVMGLSKPVAFQYADDAKLSPGAGPEPWLVELAAETFAGADDALTLKFSEYREEPSMTRDELIAKLQEILGELAPEVLALPDEALKAMLAQVGGDTFSAAMKKKFATDPTPKPGEGDDKKDDVATLSAKFAAFADDCTKRFGAMEQAVKGLDTEKKEMSAMSADYKAEKQAVKKQRVAGLLDEACDSGRLPPAIRAQWENDLLQADDRPTATFSEGADKGDTPFSALVKKLKARTPDARFADANPGKTVGSPTLGEFERQALASTAKGRAVLNEMKS